MNKDMRIAVLLTCFNRRETTLECLRQLRDQDRDIAVGGERADTARQIGLVAFLVDDGSTDGTAVAVREQFPETRIIQGDGNLFWCGGMRRAWDEAAREGFDAYLWLNDDTIIEKSAVRSLVDAALAECEDDQDDMPSVIVVGSSCDPESGEATYGEWSAQGVLPPPEDSPRRVNGSIHGNLVLVSGPAFRILGNLNSKFTHGFGDIEYGFRARKHGVPVVNAPGFLGRCARNPKVIWKRHDVPFRKRWENFHGPKGCPPGELSVFARLCGIRFWPRIVVQAYLRLIFPRLWGSA